MTLFFGLMFALTALYSAFTLFTLAVFPEARSAEDPWATTLHGNPVLLGGLWWYVRRGPRSARVLSALDVSSIAVTNALVGVSCYFWRELALISFGQLAGASFIVMGRALIVPSSARRTALVSAAGMAPVIANNAMIAILHPDISIAAPGLRIMVVTVLSSFAVVLASFGSYVIYGLREQVRAARRLGQYTLIEQIGEGGMGVVYRARHAMLRRPTVVKLLPPDRAREEDIERFEREVQLTSQLHHPNIISIYDYGRSTRGVFYYAMEYLDGFDLATLVKWFGPQPVGRVIHILRQACSALAEAHTSGLVHRDIKPANIFLCRQSAGHDVVKVLDFGLVKDLSQPVDVMGKQVAVGTPAYLAPESIVSPHQVGPAADLYGLGAVGYFLLTGTDVFTGKTAMELYIQHVGSEPDPPSDRLGEPLPPALEQILLRCLAKHPDDRFPSALALMHAFGAVPEARDWRDSDAMSWWRDANVTAASRNRMNAAGTVSLDGFAFDAGVTSDTTIANFPGGRRRQPCGLRSLRRADSG